MSANETKLKVISHDEKDQSYVVSSPMGNTVVVADTYAEMFHHTATADSVLEKSPLFL